MTAADPEARMWILFLIVAVVLHMGVNLRNWMTGRAERPDRKD